MNQSKHVATVDDLQLEIKKNDAYACPVDLNPAYEKVWIQCHMQPMMCKVLKGW